jgi:predicted nucleic acid-binding protein
MLDTMIFDKIVSAEGMTEKLQQLTDDGALALLVTHVQEDQLADISDAKKQASIERVPRTLVPTSAFALGFSRLGMAGLGSGRLLKSIRGTTSPLRHTKDGLIGATAGNTSAVLVTEDRRLRRRAVAAGVSTWDFAAFRAWVDSISD